MCRREHGAAAPPVPARPPVHQSRKVALHVTPRPLPIPHYSHVAGEIHLLLAHGDNAAGGVLQEFTEPRKLPPPCGCALADNRAAAPPHPSLAREPPRTASSLSLARLTVSAVGLQIRGADRCAGLLTPSVADSAQNGGWSALWRLALVGCAQNGGSVLRLTGVRRLAALPVLVPPTAETLCLRESRPSGIVAVQRRDGAESFSKAWKRDVRAGLGLEQRAMPSGRR